MGYVQSPNNPIKFVHKANEGIQQHNMNFKNHALHVFRAHFLGLFIPIPGLFQYPCVFSMNVLYVSKGDC